jgi:hypothetical protein
MKTILTILLSITVIANAAKADNNLLITSVSVITNTSLNGMPNNNTVTLNWTLKNNTSASKFEIERSFYSNYFSTINTMEIAFGGNNSFSINDNAAELAGRKIAYYRIKQIAANGTINYSNTKVVYLSETTSNTTSGNTFLNFTVVQNEKVMVKIINTIGKTVAVQNNFATRGNNTIEVITTNLNKGIYTAEVTVNDVAINVQKLIVE